MTREIESAEKEIIKNKKIVNAYCDCLPNKVIEFGHRKASVVSTTIINMFRKILIFNYSLVSKLAITKKNAN